MRTIYRKIRFEQAVQKFIPFAGPRMRRPPEQAVVYQEEVRFGCNRQVYRGQAGVHRGGDTSYAPEICHLQPVGCSIVIVHFTRAQQAVAVTDQLAEGNVCHPGMKTKQKDFAIPLLNSLSIIL